MSTYLTDLTNSNLEAVRQASTVKELLRPSRPTKSDRTAEIQIVSNGFVKMIFIYFGGEN
jgi:hypothetical protein